MNLYKTQDLNAQVDIITMVGKKSMLSIVKPIIRNNTNYLTNISYAKASSKVIKEECDALRVAGYLKDSHEDKNQSSINDIVSVWLEIGEEIGLTKKDIVEYFDSKNVSNAIIKEQKIKQRKNKDIYPPEDRGLIE